jgi:hypothetical protein
MPLPGFLKDIFAGGAGKLVESVTNLIDVSKFSAEEKAEFELKLKAIANAHTVEMATLAQAELDSYLKDIADSRAANVAIQNSDKASWLSKNVAYCLDIFVLLIWGSMTIYIVAKFLNIIKSQQGVDFSGVLGLYAGVTALATQIIGFHRGSSKSSEDKSKQIERLSQG